MNINNRNKFRLTRLVIFNFLWIFKVLSLFKKVKKRILIIKIDAIGDYVLFRNYLEIVKNSEKYKNYEIELIGNQRWSDLALTYDSDFVSKFYFIDPDRSYEALFETLKLGLRLSLRGYEVVLQPTYSRTLLGSWLAAFAAGQKNVAYNSFDEYEIKYKNKTDRNYTELINPPDTLVHETEFNQYFFQTILETPLHFVSPSLPGVFATKKGIVVFPGSSYPQKNWPKENVTEIIRRMLISCDDSIVIAGGESERETAQLIIAEVNSPRVINRTGNTTLSDLVRLISRSSLVLTNDTSAVHIAAACGTPAICILGGGHFNRFLPYPNQCSSKPICVYHKMQCYQCNFLCSFKLERGEAFPCISHISVDEVWQQVVKFMRPNS